MYKFDNADVAALFKINYEELSDATMHIMYPTVSQVKTVLGFTGSQRQKTIPLSYGGSVGSGTLPAANKAIWKDATLTRKRVYARLNIDRETIYAAKDDKGAFVRATKEFVRKTVESYTRNIARILYGESDGSLGTVESVVDNGGGNYTLTISLATWKQANFEEADFVNIETGNTDRFEVEAVAPSAREVTVQRLTGAQIPVATDVVFMQGSENNDPSGLKGVCDATAGSLYGIPVQRRWQSYQKDALGAGITPDLLTEAVLTMTQNHGRPPKLITMSYAQFRHYIDQLEDQKRYPVSLSPRDERFKGLTSFSGVQHMGPAGAIPIMPDQFVEDDRVYLLNPDYIEWHKADGFGWFDDDGTVLLRAQDSDEYEARYGGYMEFFIHPHFQGVITNLAR